ncbi:hypothetical protein [Tenacibaculum aestuariivivum]|uniref:hypothetical protein n=1 Tax=Tenacibaculum aestuariivivum TaxID=2006131 RepID=UPI003AB591A5
MAELFKHNYFKYFLLVLIVLKGIFVVAQNIDAINTIEICYQLDTDDFENESEDRKELDESEKINQLFRIVYHFDRNKVNNNYITIFKKYKTQYLEFTTQPPELL